jgi:hypothetical protein
MYNKQRKSFIMLFALVWMITLCTLPAIAAPAPALSDIQVYAVSSQTFSSWEYTEPSLILTRQNHGGNYLQVITKEVGYANQATLSATFNGQRMSLVESLAYPSTGTIQGWYRLWRINTSFTSGQVVCKGSSINGSTVPKTDWINIK